MPDDKPEFNKSWLFPLVIVILLVAFLGKPSGLL